jgi:hypothetical protein
MDFNYSEWWRNHFDDESEDETDDEDVFGQFDRPRTYQEPRGRVIHFIPSEHLKILKGR